MQQYIGALKLILTYGPLQWTMQCGYGTILQKHGVGFSPTELFTGIRSNHASLNQLHAWGCPTYVLEPEFQAADKTIPKWTKRSRLGQFLGYSKEHSTTVGLIRNVRTGKISPQFHAVYDDLFHTVATTFQDPNESLSKTFSSTEWETVLQNGTERYYSDNVDIPPLHEE